MRPTWFLSTHSRVACSSVGRNNVMLCYVMLLTLFTRYAVGRWMAADLFCVNGRRIPAMFIVGAQKCGTTSLAKQLFEQFGFERGEGYYEGVTHRPDCARSLRPVFCLGSLLTCVRRW